MASGTGGRGDPPDDPGDTLTDAPSFDAQATLEAPSFDAEATVEQLDPPAFGEGEAEHRQALIAVLDAQGRWDELAAALDRAIEAEPRGPRRAALSLRLAEILRDRLERPAAAATVLESLLEVFPEDHEALVALEEIHELAGDEAALLDVLQRRTRAEHDAPLLHRRIARLREGAGDVDGALASLGRAWDAEPGDRATSAAIERLCRRHQRFTELVAHYRQLLEGKGELEDADRAEILARQGEIELLELGEPSAALTSLAAAVELAPQVPDYFELAAAACEKGERWELYADLCEHRAALVSGPERLEVLRRAAEIAARCGDAERVRRLDRQLLDDGERDAAALAEMERRAAATEDWEGLVSVLERRLGEARGGDDSIALLQRIAGLAERELLDEERAVSHYLRILEIAPAHRETLEALSRIFEATEQWGELLEITRRLIRLTDSAAARALLHFKCGSVMEARFEDDDRAIEHYRAALDVSPECLPAIHGLRDLYRRRGEWRRVVETLELEIDLWSEARERAGVLAEIGRILSDELGDEEGAQRWFEDALAIDPESLPANLALFERCFAAGDWDQALPLAEAMARKAVRTGDPGTRCEFYRRRGVVLWRSGRPVEAADSILLALEIEPESRAALDALLQLAHEEPTAYDFEAVFVELEGIYRRLGKDGGLLARVLVGRARLESAAGRIEVTEALLAEARELAPQDRAILEAAAAHFCARFDVAAALEVLESAGDPDPGTELWAALRRAEILADVGLDSEAACAEWQRALSIDPDCLEALYCLAAERMLQGRPGDAVTVAERAVSVAASPERSVGPERLARHYYLLARARQAAGDRRGGSAALRRAAEYAPGYAEPPVALARGAMRRGDREAAQKILVSAAHRAMASVGKEGAVPLQRELARILDGAGDRAAAAEAYRGILAVVADPADWSALAEVRGSGDARRGAAALESLFATDVHFAPAYLQAVALHDRAGQPERAQRALAAMEALGFAGDAERAELLRRRARLAPPPPRRPLPARQRGALAAGSPDPLLDRVYLELAPLLAERFPGPDPGDQLMRFEDVAGPDARAARDEIDLALSGGVELFAARQVPGAIVARTYPQPQAVIDVELVERGGAELRFALGWAYEVVFRRLGPITCGPRRRRREVLGVLVALVSGIESPASKTLRAALPMGLERQLQPRTTAAEDVDRWSRHVIQIPGRAGLLASDDITAAATVLQRLAGYPLHDRPLLPELEGAAADLVAYYLGEAHHRARIWVSGGE